MLPLAVGGQGLTYAAINGTILAILFAAFVGYLLVVFETRDRLTTELVDTADEINDRAHFWTTQVLRGNPDYDFVASDHSSRELVEVFKALALRAEHPDLPAPEAEASRGEILQDLFAPLAQSYPFANLAKGVSLVKREDVQGWVEEMYAIALRIRQEIGIAATMRGGSQLQRLAHAADQKCQAASSSAPPGIAAELSARGVEAQFAAFTAFIAWSSDIAIRCRKLGERLKRYEERQPPRRILGLVYALGAVAFVCGVAIPMFCPGVPNIVAAYVPVAAYLVALLTGAALILRRPA